MSVDRGDRLRRPSRDDHALACREAVGLDDERRAARATYPAGVEIASVKVAYAAVGMPWRARKSLVKALEPSSRAAAAVGPKQRRPAASKASTMPATSGASGPTIVRSTRSLAREARPAPRGRLRRRRRCVHRGSRAVPALPGRDTDTAPHAATARTFQARACSRPPPPIACRKLTRRLDQCRKWRMPVNTIARPCSSAAAMTSSSRTRAAGLDHRGDARRGRGIDAVAEREERVGGHDRAGEIESFVARPSCAAICARRHGSSGRRRYRGARRPARTRSRST